MPAHLENSAVATGWEKFSFPSNPQKRQWNKCLHYCKIALISHTSKVMLKIPQGSLHKYVNQELPDVQAGFRKARGTRDQIANICWIIEKAREFHKNIYFCFVDYSKPFDCVGHNKVWNILKELGIPKYLTCLLRNLYVGQEVTVRTEHGTMNWFQIGKEVCQDYTFSPCLFNLYAENIIQNARLDDAQLQSITSDMQMKPHLWQEMKRN